MVAHLCCTAPVIVFIRHVSVRGFTASTLFPLLSQFQRQEHDKLGTYALYAGGLEHGHLPQVVMTA